jgi:3-oxoacyl-[acyl-carrier protein] reductase
MSETQLRGKVAVITGAGRGIGQAIAIAYAQSGASVCCSARTVGEINETVSRITARGDKAISVAADVTDFASVCELYDRAVASFGRVDIVVMSAGASAENKLVEEADPEIWRNSIEVNLIGAFHTAKAAIPHLRKGGGGKIILIGSGMGHRSGPTRSSYASSKAGAWMLTRILAQELSAYEIAVNELIPGPVQTRFIAGREEALRSSSASAEWFKQPEDVVPLALFLASQPQTGPTGQSFSLARREL